MNTVKRWRGGLVLAALWFTPCAGLAEDPCVESLCLSPAAPWQRGAAQQEQSDGVFQWDLAADARFEAQVLLLRRAPAIRGDASAYYDKLTRFWRDSYGQHVLIDWLDLGAVRWRSLRRPASEHGLGLFHLATVYEGRAYSLLVFVPGTVTTLPAPVRDLLSGIRFMPVAGAPAPRWVRTRIQRFNLSGEVLEAVVAPEAERMGQDGMLTGYGLDYGESSVSWFMEGFRWNTLAGRVVRAPWATRGRLEVEAPHALTHEGGPASWTLRLALPEGEEAVHARLVLWDLCAPAAALADVLERLGRGARGPMERLAHARSALCPAPAGRDPGWHLSGVPGKRVEVSGVLPPPPRLDEAVPSAGALRQVRVVEALLEPEPERSMPGDRLLERARLFFVYEPR